MKQGFNLLRSGDLFKYNDAILQAQEFSLWKQVSK